ncbi:Pup--protein ligase [Bifidobacterium ramosum]|uniref:Pup--protein ligase n=1 Tax=Bifidobacterium ramosum TaxID=1798158 RepID=A0A6L4X2K9_9BIFI|nr:Pup--protein ligase [Bifidobacterium ramosum]KAB8288946.1 Pup--protein ligase [Bifidobacterium ramosum]NEG70663.1 Pup--protein ligase [Bifidobacterium ramosum]
MPQLRDSGNSGPGSTVRQSPEFEGFARIFGIETEYGVSVTGAGRPVDAGQVAMMMFQPIVSRSRSTNTYLTNGSRLYLDVGSHPEYATAEARRPLDALAQDMAGELMMRRLAAQAQERLQATYGTGLRVHVFKNNADSAGHSFGCHENYLVRRFVSLEQVEHELLPFLITRQLYTGAGRVTDEGFEITQRADYLDEAVSSATTRSRPMVNTRDEPHADPEEFRRLHVIIGDSNRSQWATWMKLAVTHLVLCVIEESARLGVPSGFETFALAAPGEANRAVSRDLTCRNASLRMADGRELTALDIQRGFLRIVERFVAGHAAAMDAAMNGTRTDAVASRDGIGRVLDEWRRTLDLLDAGESGRLADRVDWAAKLRLFETLHARRGGVAQSKLEQLDMDYHDIANGTLYDALLRRGAMMRLLDDGDARRALTEPPADTRAALRGGFVAAALVAGAQFSCDWTRLTLSSPEHREAVILDPFADEPTADYRQLMQAL